MTGYARGVAKIKGPDHKERDLQLEIKSLNHRSLDIKLRTPKEWSSLDLEIRGIFAKKFHRGSLEIRFEWQDHPELRKNQIPFDAQQAASVYTALKAFCDEQNIATPPTLSDCLRAPELWKSGSSDENFEIGMSDIEPLMNQVSLDFHSMRQREGAALAKVLGDGIAIIQSKCETVRKARARVLETQKSRIQERIVTAFSNTQDPLSHDPALRARIAQELAVLVDRTDIEEEINRLEGHLDHFASTLAAGGPAGKRLEFLLQEMNREANTLSNKIQDLIISQECIEIKLAIERLREQVMNIE